MNITDNMAADTVIREGARLLRDCGIHNGFQEARWILEQVLRNRGQILRASVNLAIDAGTQQQFRQLLNRRLSGEPLQYVLRSTEFYGLELLVGPGVLIPRPETERLVDIALAHYVAPGRICDLCTGSGAIALALAHGCGRSATVVGVDISSIALSYARRNARALGLPVCFMHGDLFDPFPASARFALITANPPYVASGEFATLPEEVRAYEPHRALWAGADGFDIIRRIAAAAPRWLRADGVVVCEIGDEQGVEAKAIFRKAGFDDIRLYSDYAGRDRVIAARGMSRYKKVQSHNH